MIQTISLVILGMITLFLFFLVLWLLFSKRRKSIIEKARLEAKKERKQIIASGYKEIQSNKNAFEIEKSAQQSQLQIEKNWVQSQLNIVTEQQQNIVAKEQKIEQKNTELSKLEIEYKEKISSIIESLEMISNLSKEEAKEILFASIKEKHKNEIDNYLKEKENEAQNKARARAANIIIQAMERYKTDIVNEKTTNIVHLPSEDIKGRIIGREGRNIKAFEQYAGVEIIIDETPSIVTVSSFNPIRREIATQALKKLLLDGRIQPNKIEQELESAEKKLEEIILEEGYKTIEELGITNINSEIVKLIGKLKYRTSYGQSVLLHSIEVAKLASSIASELGLDSKEATRAGLLHDIGKAVDFEQEGSHVMLGSQIAKKYGESQIVINTIESHHEEVPKESEIAAIVAIADAMSASRPGARNNALDEFIQRMSEIEKQCMKIPGVAKAYALQSGRNIRIIVDPMMLSDIHLTDVIDKIKSDVLSSIVIPGDITITVIRETRQVKVLK